MSKLSVLLCSVGWHEWCYQHDAGREKAVTMTGGGSVWMSDIKIHCGACGQIRNAKTSEDHELPEIVGT